jgi:hypothetical protein
LREYLQAERQCLVLQVRVDSTVLQVEAIAVATLSLATTVGLWVLGRTKKGLG